MNLKTKIIIVLGIVILTCCGLSYYKLHNIVKGDLEKVKVLESKNEQLKNSISRMDEEVAIQKERLSIMKDEIKNEPKAVTKVASFKEFLEQNHAPTQEEYEKYYANYIFKKKVLDNNKEELNKNQKEIDEIKKEIARLNLFK